MELPSFLKWASRPRIVANSALPDDRPKERREKDWLVDEVVAAVAPAFQHERPTALGATVFNQWYVGSCVPHADLTQLEYEGILTRPMSQLAAYRKRVNYPQPGSGLVDMYDKIRDGQHVHAYAPTRPNHTEAMATAMPYARGEGLLPEFNYFQFSDLTKIPGEVAAGKAVMIFIFATEDEWSREYVEVRTPNLNAWDAYVRHAVVLMPRGDFSKAGQGWLAVHDSAAFGGRHLRYISYNFLLTRCYGAAEVRRKEVLPVPPPKPAKPFETCKLGDRSKAVRDVQAYLITENFLEPQYHTGYYGAITAKAVLWWQLYYHRKFDAVIPQLLDWKGHFWGVQSVQAARHIIG